MTDKDYNPPNTTVRNNEKVFIPKPYQEVNWFFGSPLLMENLGDLFYNAVALWPNLPEEVHQEQLVANVRPINRRDVLVRHHLSRCCLKAFVETDKKDADGNWEPQHFWDSWWRGLPMDNQMDDRLMGVIFTELWIPIEHTADVMNTLKASL